MRHEGHAARKPHRRVSGSLVVMLCACKCGEQVPLKPKSRPGKQSRFVVGHDPVRRQRRKRTCDHVLYPECGCPGPRKYTKPTGELATISGKWRQAWSVHSHGAKVRGLKNTLTIQEFVRLCSANCSYCGALPTLRSINGYSGHHANGIDRIDNTEGYVLENCTTACSLCNTIKKAMTLKQFLNHIERIYNHSKISGLL
jgi:hypothetical protein